MLNENLTLASLAHETTARSPRVELARPLLSGGDLLPSPAAAPVPGRSPRDRTATIQQTRHLKRGGAAVRQNQTRWLPNPTRSRAGAPQPPRASHLSMPPADGFIAAAPAAFTWRSQTAWSFRALASDMLKNAIRRSMDIQ
jgi:hypothetical protein